MLAVLGGVFSVLQMFLLSYNYGTFINNILILYLLSTRVTKSLVVVGGADQVGTWCDGSSGPGQSALALHAPGLTANNYCSNQASGLREIFVGEGDRCNLMHSKPLAWESFTLR